MSAGRIHHSPVGPIHVGGRLRPTQFPAPAMLAKYIDKSRLPTPPETLAYAPAADSALADILGNDTLGDCTAAGACHLVEAYTAAAGSPVKLTREEAIKFYSLSTGYVSGEPSTDKGGSELTVLSYWQKHGLDGNGAHAIAAIAAVDPHDGVLVRVAAWLFGLYFGLELPDSYLQISGNGFVWGAGKPDFNNGHCVVSRAYTKEGPLVDTWGYVGTITDAAVSKLCDASSYGMLNAVLSHEMIAAAKILAPSGFDFDQLEDDLALVKSAA